MHSLVAYAANWWRTVASETVQPLVMQITDSDDESNFITNGLYTESLDLKKCASEG